MIFSYGFNPLRAFGYNLLAFYSQPNLSQETLLVIIDEFKAGLS
jgi:hypothetical protein